MNTFKNSDGYRILNKMVAAIQENKVLLGDVDGLIGDGDHGMNMNKGFTLFETQYGEKNLSFADGLDSLGNVLFSQIGGSMGPIYGTIFMALGESLEDCDDIDLNAFRTAFEHARSELFEIIDARVGDKTLVDCLSPAVDALSGDDFSLALKAFSSAAEKGKESTKELVAKYGRSSRLGERSRGVLDAGSVSCNLILQAMAAEILVLLEG